MPPPPSNTGLLSRVDAHLLGQVANLFQRGSELSRHGDAETLHQMRVLSRRLRTNLRFFGELFTPRELAQVRRQLRRVTRGLGEVRARDVNLRLLRKAGAPRLEHRLLAERAARLTEFRALWQRLRTGRLEEQLRALLAHAYYRSDRQIATTAQENLNELRRVLRKRHDQFENRGPRALHKLRLAVKRYRYAIEAAQTVFAVDWQPRLAAIKELQDRLGEHHDAVELAAWLEPIAAATDRDKTLAKEVALVVKFARVEEKRRRHRVEEFLAGDRSWRKKLRLRISP